MPTHSIPAAEYVRMSTDNQKYSIVNQQAAIGEYGRSKGFEIVESFKDPGLSGLDLKHRPGLRALLNAVVSGAATFKVVLVLDVSRWGRFQDADESAYYEFLCRRAGVKVHYCKEAFENDQTAYSSLIKSMKRTMAAEYSRELSDKCFAGGVRLARLGFKQDGIAPLGLGRMLVDERRNPKQMLPDGEHKSILSDRVVFVPGPEKEVRVVRWIFNQFASGSTIKEITQGLRRKSVLGRSWTHAAVQNILEDPKYVGTYVYNRSSARLGTPSKRNSRDRWIYAPDSIPAIIVTSVYQRVQERLSGLTIRLSNEEMLEKLKSHAAAWGTFRATRLTAAEPCRPQGPT